MKKLATDYREKEEKMRIEMSGLRKTIVELSGKAAVAAEIERGGVPDVLLEQLTSGALLTMRLPAY